MQSYNLTMKFLSSDMNIILCRKNGHKTHPGIKNTKMSQLLKTWKESKLQIHIHKTDFKSFD